MFLVHCVAVIVSQAAGGATCIFLSAPLFGKQKWPTHTDFLRNRLASSLHANECFPDFPLLALLCACKHRQRVKGSKRVPLRSRCVDAPRTHEEAAYFHNKLVPYFTSKHTERPPLGTLLASRGRSRSVTMSNTKIYLCREPISSCIV